MSEIYPVSIEEIDNKTTLDPAAILEATKRRSQEMSAQNNVIELLGPLSDGEHPDYWKGSISLSTRLSSGEIVQYDVESLPHNLSKSFVPVSRGAAIRCADDSQIEGYNSKSAISYGRPLGPQVIGGTAGEALAMRLILGHEPSTTLITDIDRFLALDNSDFLPGGHTDVNAHGDDSGCGLIDKAPVEIDLMSDPDIAGDIANITNSLWKIGGKKLPENIFDKIQQTSNQLKYNRDYFPKGQEVLAKLRSYNPNGVEVLKRPHSAISLTINYVTGTTHDKDAYNEETNGRIGNFNLDAWYILKKYDDDRAYAMIADAVATLMAITDGSIMVLIRRPTDVSSNLE